MWHPFFIMYIFLCFLNLFFTFAALTKYNER